MIWSLFRANHFLVWIFVSLSISVCLTKLNKLLNYTLGNCVYSTSCEKIALQKKKKSFLSYWTNFRVDMTKHYFRRCIRKTVSASGTVKLSLSLYLCVLARRLSGVCSSFPLSQGGVLERKECYTSRLKETTPTNWREVTFNLWLKHRRGSRPVHPPIRSLNLSSRWRLVLRLYGKPMNYFLRLV